jgi:hypothetical protein
MTTFLFCAVVMGAVISLTNYRIGLVLIAAAGLLQDPIRKTLEGQSPYLMGLVLVFFAATLLGALAKSPPRWWRRPDWRQLRVPMALFGLVLVLQSLVTYLRTGSVLLIGIGLAAYLGPVLAVVLGSWTGAKKGLASRFLSAYLVLVVAMASGIALWQAGYRWDVLQSIGVGLTIYDWELGAVVLPSGFFRAPEVASWHCATGACVAIVLASSRKATFGRWAILGGLAGFLFWCVLMTGRRKGIAEIVIFVALFAVLQVWVRGRLGRFGGAVLAAVVLGGFALQQYGLADQAEVQIASMRGRSSHAGGASGRMVSSLTSLPRVVAAAGPLGTGIGTGTQGAQHFRTSGERWSRISESGLARVIAELGVFGAAIALILIARLGTNLRRRVPSLLGLPVEEATRTLGLMALLGANIVVFVSAHQIFGDPFVYIFLGLSSGFVISALDLGYLARRRRSAAELARAA